MDDVNNMDESMETGEPSAGVGEEALLTGVDRRTMLKAAVAAGTLAGTWVAPRIETFGFAPAGAATVCVVENPSTDDLNLNESDNTYVSANRTRCPDNGSASFGNSGGQPDRIRFQGMGNDPFLPGCDEFVVRTRPEDCPATSNTDVNDPDVTGFAVVVDLEETDPNCDCVITKVTIYSSNRASIIATFTQATDPYLPGPCTDPITGNTGAGILVDFTTKPAPGGGTIDPCTLQADARLAVTIECTTPGPCPTTTTTTTLP